MSKLAFIGGTGVYDPEILTDLHEKIILLGDLNCHINLIPINGTEHIKLFPPSTNQIFRFQRVLTSHGRNATVRRQMGDEIQAACGQLKRRFIQDVKNSSK